MARAARSDSGNRSALLSFTINTVTTSVTLAFAFRDGLGESVKALGHPTPQSRYRTHSTEQKKNLQQSFCSSVALVHRKLENITCIAI